MSPGGAGEGVIMTQAEPMMVPASEAITRLVLNLRTLTGLQDERDVYAFYEVGSKLIKDLKAQGAIYIDLQAIAKEAMEEVFGLPQEPDHEAWGSW
jgi:hypothetical protein